MPVKNRESQAQGLLELPRVEVRSRVLAGWDAFLTSAEAADLGQKSRLPGWRGHEICVHLGSWEGHRAMAGLIESARGAGPTKPVDVDEANAAVTARYRDASRDDVLSALRRNRDEVADYLSGDSDDNAKLDRSDVVATVGTLPLLTVAHATLYELAVHALDLVSCGSRPPSDELMLSGISALADVTGALAATLNITGGAVLSTPKGGWYFAADQGGWTTTPTEPGETKGRTPVVEADLVTLLDASAGRQNPVSLLPRRKLKVHHMSGLMRLAPIVESAPGIPGGPVLRLAARTVGSAGGVVGKLTGRG
ncbi:MAG TPA: maleylpyruvate isomerase N-terminal domain-containing protein [Frankiaceae bacterium]|nr:maleylpyruvate isomerase N-terminal domain-containing protein [Frankiaceae bacterium]